ncbi:MAG: tyrosine-type recombinase/integrase, partial [bacterium]
MPEGSDMHRQSHLVQQPSTRTYFFRSIIPKALRNHFDGQREFKVSLGCKSKARSQRASFHLYGVVHHLYDSIQAGQSQMTLEEIKHILRIELEKSFRYIKHIQLRTNRYNAERVQAAIADLEAKKSSRLDYYANKSEQTEERIEEKLSKYEQRFGQQWDRESLEYLQLKEQLKELYLKRLDWAIDLLEGKDLVQAELIQQYESTLQTNLQWLSSKTATSSLSTPPESTTVAPAALKTASQPNPNKIAEKTEKVEKAAEMQLSKLMQDFLREKEASNITTSTVLFHQVCCEDFVECVGDMPVTEVNKAVVRKYLEMQKQLPAQRKKNPRYAKKTIEQILKMKGVEPQSITNINKKVSYLKQFFKWLVYRFDEVGNNPFDGMNLANKAQVIERGHFTDSDLQKILGKEYLSSTVHRVDKESRFYIKHGVNYYWAFLIGIYSGMRTEEICKLRVDEIQQEEGIWFFDIKGRVKTKNSVRRVPIHKQLIDLGLLKYMEIVAKQGEERLFWSLPIINEKYSKTVSKFFNDSYLKKVGVYEPNTKILYSTRHTFITRAKVNGVEDALLKKLVGHEQEFTQKHYAANMFDLAMLQQGINRVEYPSLDLKALRVKWD